jgi:alanine racemase
VNRVLVAFQRRSGWNVPWRLPRVRWDELIGLARRGQRARTVRVGASWGTFRWPTGPIPRRTRRRLLVCTRRSRRSGRRGSVSPLAHLAATSGTVTDPATHFGMVRVGAGLVGIDPSGTVEMHGASRLTAPIVHTTAVKAGMPVGYAGTYVTDRATI